jgi:hypothetical protein
MSPPPGPLIGIGGGGGGGGDRSLLSLTACSIVRFRSTGSTCVFSNSSAIRKHN